MKKILPHFLTSIITVCVVFSGLFVYNSFFKDDSDKTCSETIASNVTITESDSIQSSVEKIYDAVVLIETYDSKTLIGTGTGFVYKKDDNNGYILTNYHVIEDGNIIKVTFTDGETFIAKLIGYDQYYDVAVLTVDSNAVINVAEIGSSEEAQIGDTVFTVGSPLGSNYMGTVTKGILSGKDRRVTVKMSDNSSYVMEVLQTDAAINPGNSGGPLVNINGQVIGINSLKLVQSQIEGMGFTIPIDLVMSCIDLLEKGEEIQRPYLGVETTNINNIFYLNRYNIHISSDVTFGSVIVSIENDSPASKAGLQVGDIILSIDDVEVKNSSYVRYILYKHKIGDKVKIKYYRNNSINEVEVLLNKSIN